MKSAIAALALFALAGCDSIDGIGAVKDDAVASGKTIACNLGTVLANAAAAKAGFALEDTHRAAINSACAQLASRVTIAATVYDDDKAKACGEMRIVRAQLASAEERAALSETIDAACNG